MKYANGTVYIKGKQVSAFVCAKTYKRIIELLENHILIQGISYRCFNDYWNKCGNDKMKRLAKDQEGIWISKNIFGENYVKI